MTSDGDRKKQENAKGFAGLSSMVSDVDSTLKNAQKHTQEAPSTQSTRKPPAPETAVHESRSEPETQTYQQPAPPPDSSSTGKWLLGIGAVFGVLWLAAQPDDKGSSNTSSYPRPQPSASAPLAPNSQPPAGQTQTPGRPTEQRPSVGQNNVLTIAQIRYCLAEEIRLDAAGPTISSYDHSEVDRFNGYIGDYNSRCSAYRYRDGTLERARREIEPYRRQLAAEGRERFARGSTSAPRGSTTRSLPDPTVRAIQQRLNELGYDAGTVDGLFGPQTRSAIIAFQKEHGLEATGTPSLSLLQVALTVVNRRQSNGSGGRTPDLSRLSSAERQSIESACSTDKYMNGPAAYNRCLADQLAAMSGQSQRPDLSRLSSTEKQSIESVCSTDKYMNGPAAYNKCLQAQLIARDRQGISPDLSRLSLSDRRSIEASCSTDKYVNGPAAYNRCLSNQLKTIGY